MGPCRIIEIASGEDWCDECHTDADDGTDRDSSLYVIQRKPDGTCACCGTVVVAGRALDIPASA